MSEFIFPEHDGLLCLVGRYPDPTWIWAPVNQYSDFVFKVNYKYPVHRNPKELPKTDKKLPKTAIK